MSQLALHQVEETEEEVRARRGTPDACIMRVRRKFSFGDDVSDVDVFYRACTAYYHAGTAHERADKDYSTFKATGELPTYMWRYGDPDLQ